MRDETALGPMASTEGRVWASDRVQDLIEIIHFTESIFTKIRARAVHILLKGGENG